MSSRPRPRSYDLRQDIDERAWVNTHPVYCPMPYCDAHQYRWAVCGAEGEPFIGIHEGRIRAVPRFRARVERLIAALMEGGSTREEAEKAVALTYWLRDGAEVVGPRKVP